MLQTCFKYQYFIQMLVCTFFVVDVHSLSFLVAAFKCCVFVPCKSSVVITWLLLVKWNMFSFVILWAVDVFCTIDCRLHLSKLRCCSMSSLCYSTSYFALADLSVPDWYVISAYSSGFLSLWKCTALNYLSVCDEDDINNSSSNNSDDEWFQ